MAFWLNCYYIVVLAWALFYLWDSLARDVPWRGCNNFWNTKTCKSEYDLAMAERVCLLKPNAVEATCRALSNASLYTSPVREYWERNVLQVTGGMEEVGTVRWPLALTLFIAWVACYFAIWKGVKWTGKVSNYY